MGLVFRRSSFFVFCLSFVRVGGFEGGLGRGGAAVVLFGDFKVVCVWICSNLVHKIPFGFFTGFVL
jgi:hypothetical protein